MGCFTGTTGKKVHVIAVLILGLIHTATSAFVLKKLNFYMQRYTEYLIGITYDDPFGLEATKEAYNAAYYIHLFTCFAAATLILVSIEMLCCSVTLPVVFVHGGMSLAGGCCFKMFQLITIVTLLTATASSIGFVVFTFLSDAREIFKLHPESRHDLIFMYGIWIGSMLLRAGYCIVALCIICIEQTWKEVVKTAVKHEKKRSEPKQNVVLTQVRDIDGVE